MHKDTQEYRKVKQKQINNIKSQILLFLRLE